VDGPFNLPGLQFPVGAIALHIHSYSAATLRASATGWAGPLVARGVTATFGNVHEPYLQFTHRPDLLLRALARGDTLAEAAYHALVALSWQAIVIGDPLYRPFALSLEKQLSAGIDPYSVLRQMNLLEADGQRDAALALARATLQTGPSLVVGLALAQRLQARGEAESAANALGFVPLLQDFTANEWAVAREAALLLEGAGRPRKALDVWQNLLRTPLLPEALRRAWLPDAGRAAVAAQDEAQAEIWRRELAGMAPRKER
jgi:hypothetical protein